MKLAEALLERKSIKEQLDTLRERLIHNVRIQEGDEPTEKPQELMEKINESVDRLEKMIININRINVRTKLSDGATIMEAIARRDMLKLRHDTLTAALQTATEPIIRLSRSEVKFQVTVDVKEMHRELDRMAKEYRELDASIQAVNWLTDYTEG
ncbi:hypothetical protein Desgi_1080 [Desulfoscipio gibsoniae DSM 7213]|uniref:Septicolysin n=1 Tax=Desulfoscipio gibsoniae DSM 7213 TaxID=767817 RepID=R4KBQ1_9FIRM|nr:DIP1984 family protein [Desulfoscipio gibsoniae]AGL00608.1 hypothetical protein Desgi_1080 [Desulfoscipio gibsoniae DSM 7213]